MSRVPSDLPEIGFGLPVSGRWATPENMVRVAQRAEDLGYASLWTFQRLLSPVGRELGPAHREVHDSLVALAYVAGRTSRIGLGTATLCAPFTAPVVLAKALASLDIVSAGRLTVGLGIGWLPEEFEAVNVPFERRGARMDEYLGCLVACWTQDPVEFHGEFYTVPDSHLGPRPVQQPHPPLLLGGRAPAALGRAGRLAQGWIGGSQQDLSEIGVCVESVRSGAREAGRDPHTLRFLLRCPVDLRDRPAGPGRRPFEGSRDQVLDDLEAVGSQGITEAFIDLNLSARVGSPSADAHASMDHAEQVLDAFAPHG